MQIKIFKKLMTVQTKHYFTMSFWRMMGLRASETAEGEKIFEETSLVYSINLRVIVYSIDPLLVKWSSHYVNLIFPMH